MNAWLPLALLITGTPAIAATAETANGDWSKLPELSYRGSDHLPARVVVGIHSVATQENCRLPGQSRNNLDLRLSFAAQFSPDGSLHRVIMPRLNCPKVESALGGVLIEMINAGDYRPTGKSAEGWYRGVLSFTSES